MLVAASVAGVLVTNVNDISNSIDAYSGDVADKIDTDVEIISDPGSDAVYNASGDENVTLLVKNTGQKTLAGDGSDLDILLDGEYVATDVLTTTVPVGGGNDPWRRGVVAELEIDRALEIGAHRIVIDANGDREVFEFYVP